MQLVLERAAANSAESDASDTVHNAIGKSLSELSKAHETVNRFMEITHPESAVAERPVGLYQIAKRTMSVLADSALRRRMTIAVKNMDVAPLMAVLPREVEQVVYNLIQRAIDAAHGDAEQKLAISCTAGR